MGRGEHIEISIILIIFNPDLHKFLMTLASIQMQMGINMEILICDDGSRLDVYNQIQKSIQGKEINNEIFMLRSETNQGIVKNVLKGLEKARGKYVYMISPGDCLIDKSVLKDMYSFSEEKKAKICFGNAIYYNVENDLKKSYINFPPLTHIYSEQYSVLTQKMYFSLGNYILGPTYLRERQSALDGYRYISKYVKYADDSSCTLYSLCNGTSIYYFNRNILFYEIGCGVTSSKNSNWGEIINQEIIKIYEKLSEKDDVVNKLLKIKKEKHLISKIGILLMLDFKYLFAYIRIKFCVDRKAETVNSRKEYGCNMNSIYNFCKSKKNK